MNRAEIVRRLEEYAARKGLSIGERLGFGVHGSVFAADCQTEGGRPALKCHERESSYVRVRDVYLRLREHEITTVRGCNIPELLDFDDDLWVIEMTTVTRPFVLDFAG